MPVAERIQRTTRARRPESERSDRSKKQQEQNRQQRPQFGNQAMLRMLGRGKRPNGTPPAQEPDTPEGKADQVVSRFEADPMDQSGRTRADLKGMEPEQRDQVMGRVQDKVSQTQFGRIEQITSEPGPRSPETPPKEVKPGEQPEEVPAGEDKQKKQEPEPTTDKEEEKKKPEEGRLEEQPAEARKQVGAPEEEKKTEGASAGEKKPGKEAPAEDKKAKAAPQSKKADPTKGEKPDAQKQSEATRRDQAEGEAEAEKAKKANQNQPAELAKQAPATATEPGQNQAAQALSELPSDAKGLGTQAPAAPGAPARQAAAQTGPAVTVAGGGGGGGGGGAEAALEEGAGAESPEQEAAADEAEEKMAGAEGSTEEEEDKQPEPPEPEAKAESEEDLKKKPTSEDQEAIEQAERERQEQTRSPEGADATQSGEEEQEPPPAERADVNPAEARAGLESLAEGTGGGEPSGGGGGGGGAVSDQPQPEPPSVESLSPVSAISAVSGLKVGQISQSIAGVQSSVSQKMSGERSDLAANAPSMERPSGSPQTREGPIEIPEAGDAGTAKVEETPQGEAVPVEEPQPLPDPGPSPTDEVAAPPIQGGGEGGTLTEADAQNMQAAVDDVPTSDPALDQNAGPPPTVDLVGDADPQQAADQRAALDQTVVQQQQQGAQDIAQPMGENQIYPEVPQETLTANVQPAGGGAGAATAPAVDDETAAIVAEEKQGDEVRASAQQASSGMQAGEDEHATNVEQEKADHETKVQGLESENAAQQSDQRSSAASEVEQLRGKWSQGQQQAVGKAQGDADSAQQTMSGEVEAQKQQGDQKASAEIEKGNTEAATLKEKAQADATRKKAEAKQESSGGILGWIASAATAFFEGLKKAVHAVFDLARKALKTLIDGAKKLAAAAIDLARNAVVGAIRLAGKAIVAVGDVVLAAFPDLRDQFRGYIEDKVKAAEDTVNKLADDLKAGINKLLDLLGSALDGLLNLLEKAYMAAIDVVAKVVQGAIKAAQAAIALLGVFAAIIKDIAANPGQWISNLGAAVIDGIKNHLWKAFKAAVKNWFQSKLEEVLGVGVAIFNILVKGGIKPPEVGKMAFEGLKAAIPIALIGILVEKLAAMIVPAAGAVMVIIEGLQASWGAISRILQAIDKFISFLKAVKTGTAGAKFAAAVAAAAVVVIDFVANWLIKRIRGPASKIGGKIKAIAKKIMAKLKAVAKKIGGAIKKAAKKIAGKIKAAFRKIKAKLFGKKKRKPKDSKKKKQTEEQKKHERLNKAIGVIRPAAQSMISSHASSWRLKSKLMYWKLRYRLSKLALVRQGKQDVVEAAASPTQIAAQAVHLETSHVHKIIRDVADKLMQLPEVQRKVEQLVAQRAGGAGATPEEPVRASSSPLVTGTDISQNPRTRPKEFFEVGEAPGAVATGSMWRPGTSAPNAMISAGMVGDPTYSNLVTGLPAIGGAGTAQLLQQFHETGFVPPTMPQAAVQTVGTLTQITGVEIARDPPHAVRYATALDAMKRGTMTPEDVFILQNPLAPAKQKGVPSAPRTASEISTEIDPDKKSRFKTPVRGAEAKALPEEKAKFLAKEKQVMIAWMQSRMVGTDPLFSTEEEVRVFIREHMYDYLMHLARSTFGV